MIDISVFEREEYWIRGNPLFGDWPDVPRNDDAWYVETPVGEECAGCGEVIEDEDFGEVMPYVGDRLEAIAQHAECSLLNVVGHTYGACRCTDYVGTGNRRLAALWLWEKLASEKGFE